MFKVLFLVAFFVGGIVGQTVDVQFYDEEECSNVGGSCNALAPDDCCGSADLLWTSISTNNWQNIAAGTEVRVHSPQGGRPCGVLLVDIEEGECLVNEVPDVISAAAFINGHTRKRRSGTAATKSEACTNAHPIDEYFYQPGDGFRSIIDAQNTTHAAAFMAAATSDTRAKYIAGNFDKKVAIKAPTKVTKHSN